MVVHPFLYGLRKFKSKNWCFKFVLLTFRLFRQIFYKLCFAPPPFPTKSKTTMVRWHCDRERKRMRIRYVKMYQRTSVGRTRTNVPFLPFVRLQCRSSNLHDRTGSLPNPFASTIFIFVIIFLFCYYICSRLRPYCKRTFKVYLHSTVPVPGFLRPWFLFNNCQYIIEYCVSGRLCFRKTMIALILNVKEEEKVMKK